MSAPVARNSEHEFVIADTHGAEAPRPRATGIQQSDGPETEAAECRDRAVENEALAALMSRHDYRDYFLEIASEWSARAEAIEATKRVAANPFARPGAADPSRK